MKGAEKVMKDREKAFMEQKADYMELKMSELQIAQMKKKIEQAKRENQTEREQQITSENLMENQKEKQKENRMMKKDKTGSRKHIGRNLGIAAAAAVAVMVALPNTSMSVAHAMEQVPFLSKWVQVVTFRDYQYEDERNRADIEVPNLLVEQENLTEEEKQSVEQTETDTAEQIKLTTEEINAEIEKTTQKMIAEFEEGLKAEEGYQNMSVSSEILATTDSYFTLKLNCFQAAGSGAEWNYYYTIDLRSGKQIALADLFVEGADYITPISENIKEQMREQMAADDMVSYWLDDPEVEEWNFDKITDETSFYLNEAGEIVIAFNEGDVAPMYMGCVQFVIPDEALSGIRK